MIPRLVPRTYVMAVGAPAHHTVIRGQDLERVTLTEKYLAELETAGLSSEELLGRLPQNKILNRSMWGS
ncbi:hypothetical protein [Streptosporangium sp. NPDC006007]|uniref:hypothetical protein n=1 Tax=Streptosporangium sp. NPDC006007 TaxID=3154575 RepID=UPI0033A4B280